MDKRYTDYNSYLRQIFGCRVQKISIDAGCPAPIGTVEPVLAAAFIAMPGDPVRARLLKGFRLLNRLSAARR